MSHDKNVEAVRQKLLDRSQVGLSKYGVTTQRTDIDLVGWLNHAQEEAMDFAIYLEAAKTLAADIATLEQENRQMRARMERLGSINEQMLIVMQEAAEMIRRCDYTPARSALLVAIAAVQP